MAENPPVVYVLHGEDELAITQFVASLQARLGDSAMVDMNTTRLDGRSITYEELETAVSTLPFLVRRRLVIVTHPTARFSHPSMQKKFTALLEKVSPAVAVVLIEHKPLTEERDRKHEKLHWLEKWAQAGSERVMLKAFPLPQGPQMARRIQELSRQAGGQISPPAAELLATYVGDSPMIAGQEIQKLLAYVNYSRPVEMEDVQHLTEDQGHGDIFAMVDAMSARDGRRAVDMLHRLLEEQDSLSIFGMVVRQFRLLLQAREVLDAGGQVGDVTRLLKTHPFVSDKITKQARLFSLPVLEAIYHRLLDIDEEMKTGELEGSLALDSFIATLTT